MVIVFIHRLQNGNTENVVVSRSIIIFGKVYAHGCAWNTSATVASKDALSGAGEGFREGVRGH